MASFGKRVVLGAVLASVVLASGCARLRKEEVSLENTPPEQIFQQAEAKLTERRGAEDAAVLFTEVERLYPYSE